MSIDIPGSSAAAGKNLRYEAQAGERIPSCNRRFERGGRNLSARFNAGGVRAANRIALQSAITKVARCTDRFGDPDGLFRGTRAGAMIADIEVNESIHSSSQGTRSRVVPSHLIGVIDDGHCAGGNNAGDLRSEERRVGKEGRSRWS